MSTTHVSLPEVLAQLPDDLQSGAPAEPSLADLVASAGGTARPMPSSRFSRFWTLGTLQGKIAAAYAFWWLRSMWSSEDQRDRALNETHLKAAVQLLGTMSHLRGAVMKLGQVISHWPTVAPDEFAEILGRLQFQAPPMHFSLLREAVRAELGADPEDLFDDFEIEAFAAASLGQVHRARLKGTQTRVAIKIQYPSIARAIRDDIAALRALMLPMRLGADNQSIQRQLADVEAMLAIELDYTAEADALRIARQTLAGLDSVVVPRVHEQFSTSRVLTMDLLEGDHLPAYLAKRPSQAERDRNGSLIARGFMRMCYSAHMLYADIHTGNILFLHDGRLGFIDFGCVRRYSPAEVAYLTRAEQAAFISRDAIRQAVIEGADLTPAQQQDAERINLMIAYYDWVCEPTTSLEPFDFANPEYIRRGMDLWRQLVTRRYVRAIPVNTWISKSFIGLRAMLFKLGATVPLGRILREETSVPLP